MATEAVKAELVGQLREVVGVGDAAARNLLEVTNWNLDEAISLHFAQGEDDGMHMPTSAPAPPPPAPSPPPRREAASESAPSAPRERPARAAEGANGSWFGGVTKAFTALGQTVMGVASEDFEEWFISRFGHPAPVFSQDTFSECVKATLAQERLLILWLHQDEGEATYQLAQDVFQNEMILDVVDRSYVVWGGDVSRFEPAQIARLLGVTVFPALCLLQPLRNGFDQFFCLEWPLGTFAQPLLKFVPQRAGALLEADEVIAGITSAAQDHDDKIRAREERTTRRNSQINEERMLREAQDAEFQESLLMDQMSEVQKREQTQNEKEEAATQKADPVSAPSASASASSEPAPAVEPAAPAAEAPKKDAEAEAKESEAERESRRQARAAEILAKPEPAAAGNATARIQLKLPKGQRLQRIFRADEKLETVYAWADCCRPEPVPQSFVLCTNFPTASLTDRSATLGALGLPPSAVLMLKDDS
eukprot:gnl/TRDRNA2_/TRDRNA2_51381_c0_seq2.p1 gnl/TRDRNA2_/TRDRNA2_51381_c0~~gnl/TRDRNA2_/TRDRNA2_51381_c0_seq2.p1  ORF type:complete len:479 (+),score=120.93 gnl/TRDRNA2_/TRDRNA2_51381_c0_seq2:73-1509(+)